MDMASNEDTNLRLRHLMQHVKHKHPMMTATQITGIVISQTAVSVLSDTGIAVIIGSTEHDKLHSKFHI